MTTASKRTPGKRPARGSTTPRRSPASKAADAPATDAPAAERGAASAPAAKTNGATAPVRSRAARSPGQPKVDDPAGKLLRDRFTMPAEDFDLIKLLKQRLDAAGRPTRKNELLRAGLHALRESGTVELIKALERLPPVRRKGKHKG